MKNVALGQYYPAQSPLHKLDPRIKLILAMLYIVAAFLCKNILGFAVLAATALLLILISRVPLKTVLRSLRVIVFVLLFTVMINLFMTKDPDAAPLVSLWIFEVYIKGLYSALFIAIRIFCMIIGTCMLLTYTTTPIALTDALERLLSPLRLLKLPDEVQLALKEGVISMGHAKAIAGAEGKKQTSLLRKCVKKDLSVRQMEAMVRAMAEGGVKSVATSDDEEYPEAYLRLVEQLEKFFSQDISIKRGKNGGGKIIIGFDDDKDIERFIERFKKN